MTKWATVFVIGWYLLVPPVEERNGKLEPVFYYWLAKWDQQGAYDTAKECQNGLDEYVQRMQHVLDSARTEKMKQRAAVMTMASFYAKCVASDDPNLKRPS